MSSLLQLPRELRDRIYRNLLSVTHTKTPKSAHDGCRSAASRYNWNIYPTILRVNRQIHDEARELMALDNDFVVIERAAEGLREVESDTEEEDVEVMKFDVRMWPGRPSNRVNVPGERIRISLRKDETDGGDIYVLLVEELRDFCIGLSTIGHKNGSHGLLDIHASVSFEEALSVENREVGQAREDALFNSLIKLRFLASLKVECAASERVRSIEVQVVRQSFDKYLITSTIDELVASGDHARDIHHFDVAFAYYQRASDYFHHFVKAGDHSIFIHPADPLAIEFKIMQHRALNWVEDDNFEDALRAAELALHIANQLFAIDAPTIGGPETDAQGRLKKDRVRAWICRCIKDGAERC